MLRERRTPEVPIRCGFVDSGNELNTYGELGVFPGKYQTRPSLPQLNSGIFFRLKAFHSLLVNLHTVVTCWKR